MSLEHLHEQAIISLCIESTTEELVQGMKWPNLSTANGSNKTNKTRKPRLTTLVAKEQKSKYLVHPIIILGKCDWHCIKMEVAFESIFKL